jgi:hypothetical protein
MRTRDFMTIVAPYGWELVRTTKHAQFTNTLFPTLRPVPLSLGNIRDMNPDDVENVAKNMGLRYKENLDRQPKPRPGHPYFEHYVRLGLVKP